MDIKTYLRNLIKSKKEQRDNLNEALINSDSKEERAEIGKTLKALADEIAEAEKQLSAQEEGEGEDKPVEGASEEKGAEGDDDPEGRSFNPMKSYAMRNGAPVGAESDSLSTMEYRKAFKDYVQRGVISNILKRNEEQVSGDLGILLPNTIVNEIIKGVEKVYGQLYTKVKKTNVKGGVQYPIGAFSATMYWDGTDGTDTEHGVTSKQKAGGVTEYVQFTYHIGEIRIAQSLLQTVVTVDAFEREIVKALVEAYVKAMDEAILNGDGVKQPEGILVSKKIPTANVITFTAEEMEDWKSWQKKLFAKIPLSMRKLRPEFIMTAETYESNIMTLEDANGRPVYAETYNPVTGDERATFKAREVTFVEEGGIKSFDTAAAGDVFGLYWVGEKAYAINTNMQFGYKRYFDEATNQYITKALVICDGKVLDPKYLYILKKA